MKIGSDPLRDDHQAVDEVLKQLLTALDNHDLQASYAKLDLLWARLAVHIRAEHLHLFPAVASRLNEAQPVIDHLREDHEFFMRELARALGILRDEARFAPVIEAVREVEKRLANHNEIEENQIYILANKILTESEQAELAMRINHELENRPGRFSLESWKNKITELYE